MRCDPIIMHLAQKIGEVLHVESSSSYRNKTSGQRVQILVSSLEDLPERIFPDIEDMGIDDGVVVEYSDLPNQCGRCRKMGHNSKRILNLDKVLFCPLTAIITMLSIKERPLKDQLKRKICRLLKEHLILTHQKALQSSSKFTDEHKRK